MYKNILSILISITVLPIAIYSVDRFYEPPLGSTAFWWVIQFIVITVFLAARFIYFRKENKRYFQFLNLYLIWVSFSLVRGIFVAEIYWDYKAVISNSFILFIPLIAYTVTDNARLQSIFSYFVKYTLPVAPVFLIPLSLGSWGWSLFPVSFLMLFFPLLRIHWKLIFFVITLIGIASDITVRSNVIKYGVPVLLLLFYYFRNIITSELFIKIAHKIFFMAPVIFFILAISGIFNVLNFKEYTKLSYTPETKNEQGNIINEQDIAQDSRTFIYKEVLNSALKYNYWFLGRTPARGNETVEFATHGEEVTGRKERLSNEANIPNIFTWMGVVGVFLYFLVFYNASSLAIFQSNNIYSKLTGLFVAFRWMYAWVEDYYWFDMNNLVIWIMIGTCLSQSFRRMNDLEVKLWVRGIFDKKYKYIYGQYSLEKTPDLIAFFR